MFVFFKKTITKKHSAIDKVPFEVKIQFFSLLFLPSNCKIRVERLLNILLNILSPYLAKICSGLKFVVMIVDLFFASLSLSNIKRYSFVTFFRMGSVPRSSMTSTSSAIKSLRFIASVLLRWSAKKMFPSSKLDTKYVDFFFKSNSFAMHSAKYVFPVPEAPHITMLF